MLSVIIVSYNTRELTLRCLTHLLADLHDMPLEVWVVDNASTDGSVAAIQQEFPSAKIIINESNMGFGAANNQAMRVASGKYLLLLNSDAFVHSGACHKLIQCLERNAGVGVVGPRLLNADQSLQPSCYPFPSPMRAWVENLGLSKLFGERPPLGDFSRWSHDADRIVPWVVGACLMFRREVYEQVGGFDERFFMYAEETDWQRRVGVAAWKVAFLSTATVTHYGGSSRVDDQPQRLYSEGFFESLDYYQLKHHGRLGFLSVRLAMTFGCFARLIAWCIRFALGGVQIRTKAVAKIRLHRELIWRQISRRPGSMVAHKEVDGGGPGSVSAVASFRRG